MNKVEKKVRQKYPECLFGESFNDGHLGGCNINGDPATHYPIMWEYLADKLNIESVLDVGCGFGYAVDYFNKYLKLDAVGIEGSQKVADVAITDKIKVHDFTKSPLILEGCYDLVWSSEFVEHVDRKYVDNFIPCFQAGKYAAITYASVGQSGHNHVNENTEEYWIDVFESNGFKYCPEFTKTLRQKTEEDFQNPVSPVNQKPVKNWKYPYHFSSKGLFFAKSYCAAWNPKILK